MHIGKLVFSQVIDHLPMHTFRRCVTRYQGNRYKKSFSCLDQYLCMAFAQLTYRESLRDTILQILSLTLFEKTPLFQMLTEAESIDEDDGMPNQLNLFDNFPGQ